MTLLKMPKKTIVTHRRAQLNPFRDEMVLPDGVHSIASH